MAGIFNNAGDGDFIQIMKNNYNINNEQSVTDDDSGLKKQVGKQKRKNKSAVWAMLLIFVGVILLFNNLNFLPWQVWDGIVLFWPLLLILFGVEAILGRSWLARLVVVIISLIFIGLIVSVFIVPQNRFTDNKIINKLFGYIQYQIYNHQ